MSTASGENGFRRQYEIRKDVLEGLIESGFSVSEMSKLLSVSERTIYRRMNKHNISIQCYNEIADEELESSLEPILIEFSSLRRNFITSSFETKRNKGMYMYFKAPIIS